MFCLLSEVIYLKGVLSVEDFIVGILSSFPAFI